MCCAVQNTKEQKKLLEAKDVQVKEENNPDGDTNETDRRSLPASLQPKKHEFRDNVIEIGDEPPRKHMRLSSSSSGPVDFAQFQNNNSGWKPRRSAPKS